MDDDPTAPAQQTLTQRSGVRTLTQRPVTFACAWCGAPVTELRYPGPTPTYGHACATEARRYADRVKIARRRGKDVPVRVVTTSCVGSPTNQYDADGKPEPPTAQVIIRVASEPAARAACAVLQARLDLPSDTTPTITAVAGNRWEVAFPFAVPPAHVARTTSESDAEVLAWLDSETEDDRQDIAAAQRTIAATIQALACGATLGVRTGRRLLTELEVLNDMRLRLTVQQAIVTVGLLTPAQWEPLAQTAVRTAALTQRTVQQAAAALATKRSLRGQARADLITLAHQFSDETQALAATSTPVTDAALAQAVSAARLWLDQVAIWEPAEPEERPDATEAGDVTDDADERALPSVGPVRAVRLHGRPMRHLAEHGWTTLCGLPLEGAWDTAPTFRRSDCKRCRRSAQSRMLVCHGCQKPLLEEQMLGLCPSCSKKQRALPESWW